MNDPKSKRLVMIGIRRKGEKKFRTRVESDELKGFQQDRKASAYPESFIHSIDAYVKQP